MALSVAELTVQWQGRIPTLLRHDGSAFAGLVYTRDTTPPFEKKFPDAVQQADNSIAFGNVGISKERVQSFTVECWGWGTTQAVLNNIANEDSQGIFTWEIPDLDTGAPVRHLIRFGVFEYPDFQRVTPHRAGSVEIFQAEVTDIEVLN